MLPALGAIIVGPCPQCDGLVVVFSGRTLALDKETMQTGSTQEKCDHLLSVLQGFLEKRVIKLVENAESGSEESGRPFSDELIAQVESEDVTATSISPTGESEAPITQREFDDFVNIELSLLDNSDYFKTIFE